MRMANYSFTPDTLHTLYASCACRPYKIRRKRTLEISSDSNVVISFAVIEGKPRREHIVMDVIKH